MSHRSLAFACVLALLATVRPAHAQRRGRTPAARNPDPAAVTAACSAARPLAAGDVVEGTTAGATDRFHAQCGDGAASPDAVYRLHVTAP